MRKFTLSRDELARTGGDIPLYVTKRTVKSTERLSEVNEILLQLLTDKIKEDNRLNISENFKQEECNDENT